MVEVACDDDGGPAPPVDKSAKTGPAGAVPEDTSWMDDEFVICAVEDVTAWFDRDDCGGDRDEVRSLKVRCERIRCRRLVRVDGVGFAFVLPMFGNYRIASDLDRNFTYQ